MPATLDRVEVLPVASNVLTRNVSLSACPAGERLSGSLADLLSMSTTAGAERSTELVQEEIDWTYGQLLRMPWQDALWAHRRAMLCFSVLPAQRSQLQLATLNAACLVFDLRVEAERELVLAIGGAPVLG